MKQALVIAFLAAWFNVSAQKQIEVTEQFAVEGLLKQSMTVKLNDLKLYKEHRIDSIIITNHLHERKSTLYAVRGILLKDILSKVQFAGDNPKLLSEFYFTCVASDGYKVVFSWNELFNSATGDAVYILTAHDGKPLAELKDRIALISPKDFATGRRYVKSLSKIIVSSVQ